MGKNKKQHYIFWRWLIMSIVKTPKLYVLTWGIIILAALVCLKVDFWQILGGLLN